MEPMPGERGQENKINEMIENINKLKTDVKDLTEATEDLKIGLTEEMKLIKLIDNKLDTLLKNDII